MRRSGGGAKVTKGETEQIIRFDERIKTMDRSISKLEDIVDRLSKRVWIIVGASGALGASAGLLVSLLTHQGS